jgi:hypothetical protein
LYRKQKKQDTLPEEFDLLFGGKHIKRNLAHIEQLMNGGASLLELSNRQYKMLLVVAEVYRQQLWLYEHEERSIEDRIIISSSEFLLTRSDIL